MKASDYRSMKKINAERQELNEELSNTKESHVRADIEAQLEQLDKFEAKVKAAAERRKKKEETKLTEVEKVEIEVEGEKVEATIIEPAKEEVMITVNSIIADNKLTEYEIAVLNYLNDRLSDYFGELHSDACCDDVAETTGLSVKSVKGVVGSLVKKGIIETYDTGTGYDVIHFVDQEDMTYEKCAYEVKRYHENPDIAEGEIETVKGPKEGIKSAEIFQRLSKGQKPGEIVKEMGVRYPQVNYVKTKYLKK